MERRIKIVWILSLVAMLLIVGGQGYWLQNQYSYMNGERVNELYNCVLKTVQENDSLRNLQPKRVFNATNIFFYVIETNDQAGNDTIVNNLILGAASRDMRGNRFEDYDPQKIVYKDSFKIQTSLFSDVNISTIVNLHKLEVDVPFTLQRFDSLLALRLGDTLFTTRLEVPQDTLNYWKPTMLTHGTLLNTSIEISYPYNPLKKQCVVVSIKVAPHSLLVNMGWQLLGSFCLMLLLGLCLLFQIKTILKQRKMDELRKSFTNTMIHELKRPVQTLKMCVAFLNDKTMRTDEQSMNEVVCDSMSELDNLSAYLTKLKDMTRANDGEIPLALRTFNLREVVEKLLRLYHSSEDKQLSFETCFSAETLVTADPVHIANIISNLVENAVKYSDTSVHITVDCRVHNKLLIVIVSDTGIGILASEQSRVFDKFYRGTQILNRTLPGIGLGLSYVKLLVEAHHGNVSLKSQPGKGTEITIRIPQ